ncbi:MAG: sodium/glutamate symporter [Gemmatimonadales bacterium]
MKIAPGWYIRSLLKLDFVQTLAFAGLVLFAGHGIKRLVPPLARYNIPAPVVGGLLVAAITLISRRWDVTLFQFDTLLQTPLMIAFFTSVGFGASFSLLKKGGPLVVLFLVIATVVAVLQNVIGMLVALPLGQHPLLGVLAGSVTLTGGPATGLAFAPLFEQAGVQGAATVAVAAAMVGIVTGGLLGGPIGTVLIERHAVHGRRRASSVGPAGTATETVERLMAEPTDSVPEREDPEAYRLLKTLVAFLVAMGIGSWVSKGFGALGITLPAYIGALIVAALIRNLDDLTGLIRLSQRTVDDIGNVALSLFLVLALMTLRLWELAGLAGPLAVILFFQVALIAALAYWPIYRLMGKNYDAAVMSGGFCGFMLGTTANAMANMEALVQRYGPSPKAFLVVPMVGAFFIDFTNALIITAFLNFWR